MNLETQAKFRDKILEIGRDIIKDSRLTLVEERIDSVFDYYAKYNKITHEQMAKKGELVDSHKIASCFLFSIIKTNLISISYTQSNKDSNSFPTFKERTGNEQLGFIFGLYILKVFIENEASSVEEKYIATKEIELPKCKEKTPYTHHFIQILKSSNLDIEKPDFDQGSIFVFSHIFFLLEKNNYYYWLQYK